MAIQITFEGNIGKQSEVKTTKNGKTYTNLVVASTPRKKVNGEWQDGETVWFNTTFWGALPEVLYTTGARVLITGYLEVKTYENDGQKGKSLIVTAESIGIVNKAAKTTNDPAPQNPWPPSTIATPAPSEELPF